MSYKDIENKKDTIETLETAEDNSTKTIQGETRVVPKDDTTETDTEIDNMQDRQDNKLSVIQKKEEQFIWFFTID